MVAGGPLVEFAPGLVFFVGASFEPLDEVSLQDLTRKTIFAYHFGLRETP